VSDLTESKYPGDWLKDEAQPHSRYCREEIVIKGGVSGARTLVSGQVLSKYTSTGDSGKYVGHDPDGSTGTNAAAGILVMGVTAPEGEDTAGVAIVRGPCVVMRQGLTFSADTDLDEAATVAQLEALGIKVEEGV
jgi:hypothetical protein